MKILAHGASEQVRKGKAFSLIEVVLALGLVSFSTLAILAVFQVGLLTSHSAQDDTRAAQIAQQVLASLASQAPQNFQSAALPTTSPSPAPILNLATSTTTSPPFPIPTPAAAIFYADNDGQIVLASASPNPTPTPPAGASYTILLFTNNTPSGFDQNYANEVTVSIAWPANATAANQTKRDFVRVISRY